MASLRPRHEPLLPEPLSATAEGPRPITLFRGRATQSKDLLDTVASEQSGLVLVEGASGVGKSTFVNHAKYVLSEDFFAPPTEIGVQSTSTADAVLLQILDAVVRHASDLAPRTNWQREHPAIHRARQIVMALEGGGWNLAIGGTLPGGSGATIGVGSTRTPAPPLAAPVLSARFFDELTQDLLTLRSEPYEGVIFHINNLDILMRESAASVERLFSDLREHLRVPHAHWCFLGPPGLQAEAIAGNRRVLPFVKARIELQQLAIGDVHDLLAARYEHYAVSRPGIVPTEAPVVDTVYEKFGGDLRGTLDALAKAHREYRPVDVAPLAEARALDTLAAFYRAHLDSNLRNKTMEILRFLIDLKGERFTQDDAQPVESYQGNRSLRFAELEAVDAIRFVGNDGRRKVYSFGGAARLAYDL